MLNGRAPAFQADPSGFDSRRPLRSNAWSEYIHNVLSDHQPRRPFGAIFWEGRRLQPVEGVFDPRSLLLQSLPDGGQPAF